MLTIIYNLATGDVYLRFLCQPNLFYQGPAVCLRTLPFVAFLLVVLYTIEHCCSADTASKSHGTV